MNRRESITVLIFLSLMSQILSMGCLGTPEEVSSIKTGLTEWVPDGKISNGEYTVEKDLGEMSLHFRVENDILYVGISAETHGWVAIGFGGGPGMKNTDIVIAYVLPNGTVEISDSYSAGFSGPHNPTLFWEDTTTYCLTVDARTRTEPLWSSQGR
ncbi:DOMON domain-containing protein [Thermococcus peptonophilus]|uniref:DOMON domain-containing protein n=1 Tax=Thermococcus peptonophilus TaxID=53952 RepID=UPI000AAFCC71